MPLTLVIAGLWSLGRAVAAVSEKFDLASKSRVRVECAWKLPLGVPSSAELAFGTLAVNECSEELKQSLTKVEGCEQHVEFLVNQVKKEERMPHLRGVVSF